MTILNIAKSALRISVSNTDFDDEVSLLIEECISDLVASGLSNPEAFFGVNYNDDILWDIKEIDIKDKNISKLIRLYCLAHFGLDNADKEFFTEQYRKSRVALLNKITQYAGYGG